MKSDVIEGSENRLPEKKSTNTRPGFWDGLAGFVDALKPKIVIFFRRRKTRPDGTVDEIEFRGGGKS